MKTSTCVFSISDWYELPHLIEQTTWNGFETCLFHSLKYYKDFQNKCVKYSIFQWLHDIIQSVYTIIYLIIPYCGIFINFNALLLR
jgi:hypothetical protein